ncbi:MAG TPA: thioredoxin family protein [Terriglobales bacterium]|jgi:thioredoxin 1|nr:thioredoxin family protein [Terriglobales bacterium]
MRFCRWTLSLFLFPLLPISALFAQGPASNTPAVNFGALEHWRQAVLAGDAAALQSMYSTQPQVTVKGPIAETQGADEELHFWKDRKETGLTALTFDDLDVKSDENGNKRAIFQAVLTSQLATGKSRTWYVMAAQLWQNQAGTWRIVQVMRGDIRRLEQPMHAHMNHNLYPEDADAQAELKQALTQAAKQNKRVLLVFGANWCYDCHVLDLAFHHPDLQPLLEKSYVVLHVDIGRADKNLDLAQKFHVPLDKGVPALAVLNSDGSLLFSQRDGEFESARSLTPEDLEGFLEKWKP